MVHSQIAMVTNPGATVCVCRGELFGCPPGPDGTPRVRCPVRSHVKLCGEKARKIGQQMSGVGSSDLNGDVSGAKGRGDWIKTNQGVACCIAGVAVALLVYLCSSEWAYRELRDGFRLGFFTAVAVIRSPPARDARRC